VVALCTLARFSITHYHNNLKSVDYIVLCIVYPFVLYTCGSCTCLSVVLFVDKTIYGMSAACERLALIRNISWASEFLKQIIKHMCPKISLMLLLVPMSKLRLEVNVISVYSAFRYSGGLPILLTQCTWFHIWNMPLQDAPPTPGICHAGSNKMFISFIYSTSDKHMFSHRDTRSKLVVLVHLMEHGITVDGGP